MKSTIDADRADALRQIAGAIGIPADHLGRVTLRVKELVIERLELSRELGELRSKMRLLEGKSEDLF